MDAATINRITVEPGKRGGEPCIRGLRITVWDVLGWLGAGMTEDQILDEHPDLEKVDFADVYRFAAAAGNDCDELKTAEPVLCFLCHEPTTLCEKIVEAGNIAVQKRFGNTVHA